MFNEAFGAVGLAVLIHLLLPKRWIPRFAPWNCGICLSAWIAFAVAFYRGWPWMDILHVTGFAAVVALGVLTWAPWVWTTTEQPTLPEQP